MVNLAFTRMKLPEPGNLRDITLGVAEDFSIVPPRVFFSDEHNSKCAFGCATLEIFTHVLLLSLVQVSSLNPKYTLVIHTLY